VAHTWMSGSAKRRQWAAVATGCHRTAEPTLDPGEFCEVVVLFPKDFRTRR